MIPLPKPQKYSAKLTSIDKVSKNVYLERFDLIEPHEITFFPGQTVMLYVAPGINRSMSIASLPGEKNSILLVHDVAPMGPYSKWAISAKPGDPMSFMGPLGMFIVDRESPRKKVFVATGTGIAPYFAMISDVLGRGPIDLYWGLRHEEDIFWKEKFEAIETSYPDFHFTLTLSQGPDTWAGKRGHVEEHIMNDQNNLSGCDFYLCGSKAMTDEMREKLKAAEVPETQVKFELFY